MSRVTVGIDRFFAFVIGAALVALGVLGILWQADELPWAQDALQASWIVTATEQGWWPWAAGAAGVVLVLLGLWWLAAHVPRARLTEIRLPGSGTRGILRADVGAVANAAASSLGATHGVRSATGRASLDRGRPTIVLTATVDPSADLATVRDAAERVREEVDSALDGSELATRLHVRVARS
ncbi:hypothetical protein [Rhodococcus sp. X156]|uniref:hypothetical protein n=1 Tax=Rhodococcus sp. X156 TaxID=2499145 RepID=UPI000FDB95FF|nr:hypothetical protein [Rhodococcus sp. X156]